jgi:hypothetical protein
VLIVASPRTLFISWCLGLGLGFGLQHPGVTVQFLINANDSLVHTCKSRLPWVSSQPMLAGCVCGLSRVA